MSQVNKSNEQDFERSFNAKNSEQSWRNEDESDKKQTHDWLQPERQQSGQAMLIQMREYQDKKDMALNKQELPQSAQNVQLINTNRLIFPKDLTFENFISNKNSALLYFSIHPQTKDKFDQNDITASNNLVKSRNTAFMSVYFSLALVNYYMTKYLKFKNIPWGITYKFSFFGFMAKYFLFPVTMASTCDKYFFEPPFRNSMEKITANYTFTEDPLFRETFESQKKK